MTTGAGRPPRLRTERLVLREWRETDREPFAAMNADHEVMEHFPAVQDRVTSDAFFDRMSAHWAERGYGLFAVDGSDGFIGFVGLASPRFELPLPHRVDPPVEIGWRLVRAAWGQGLASEGARAVLRYGFDDLGLPEIVSFTAPANTRSRAVMERIGMHHDPADVFDHPMLPDDDRLRRHVLYRLSSEEFATLHP